ncbi:hypothetical protein RB195_006986 [Necator americanus]
MLLQPQVRKLQQTANGLKHHPTNLEWCGFETFTLWSALPPELRFCIMLFVDFDTQETCIITNRETRLWTIAVRNSRRETVIKHIFNNHKIEQQTASIVFDAREDVAPVRRSCSAHIRLPVIC